MYLGGPPLVKAATGEDAEEQTLGGVSRRGFGAFGLKRQ